MNLLLDEVEVLETTGDPSVVDVRGIEHDSREVAPGDLFCCLPGGAVDGHDFAPAAVKRGAVALLCEHLVPTTDPEVVQARVAPGSARRAMARIAASFYGHPARELVMAGVTGTNGKTTVSHLLGAILESAGTATTVLGTLSGTRTTPESNELQRLLAAARDVAGHGRGAVAMEVSSHAVVQGRVEGIHFDVVVFTNLSHEHLDFHGSMDAYFDAKAALFTPERAVRGVVSADDPWGRRLLADARIPLVPVRRSDASDVVVEPGQTTFRWRGQSVRISLTGRVNVDNALLAAEAALALGVDPETAAAGLAAAAPVPGRLEVVAAPGRGGPPFTVMVDYAHSPAGLASVLAEARGLADHRGRVLVVFGCGGNRDRAKRPIMGDVASRLADVSFLTSDNPRDEDPARIIEEVRAGFGPSAEVDGDLVVVSDRRSAIAQALSGAGAGDVVVLAGKGHERYQEVAGSRHPFDDRLEAEKALADNWPGDPSTWRPSGPAPAGAEHLREG
jgi:UDP-N-acetylmuramoyl-L-alanyl-D-glutamate--2,6-diaminopimelate ligase